MQLNSPKIWVNGNAEATISATDRGFMYGQSLFETVAIEHQQALLLDLHLQRLQHGCQVLGIEPDFEQLTSEIDMVINQSDEKAVLRVSVSMGQGGRGYKNPDTCQATRVIALHLYPSHPESNYTDGIELGLSQIRLASQPLLAGIKHSNRLEQIIARSQWLDRWQEALLLDADGNVVEATQSNVFIVKDQSLITPDLSHAGINGVMREFILSKAQDVGMDCQIMRLSIADIEGADEVFVSNSIIGLWPVKQFQQTHYSNFNYSQKLLTVMQNHGAIPNI